MNAVKRAHFARLLEQERARIERALDRIAATVPSVEADGRQPAPGYEPEVGVSGGGPEDDAAIVAQQIASTAEIDEALLLLHETPDRYGICVTCKKRIALRRLEIVPATRYCEQHALD